MVGYGGTEARVPLSVRWICHREEGGTCIRAGGVWAVKVRGGCCFNLLLVGFFVVGLCGLPILTALERGGF